MARENSGWGNLRIRVELKKVGHRVVKTTIATTLKNNGIAPSPDRPTSRSTFLKSHAGVIAAADFLTVDVWTKRGLVTRYVFFVIHHATRMVEIAGVASPWSAARHPKAPILRAIGSSRYSMPSFVRSSSGTASLCTPQLSVLYCTNALDA